MRIIGFDQVSRAGYRYTRRTPGNFVFIHLCFSFLFVSRDEVLEATSLQRARFEVARTKRNRAREAADYLLLSLYVHIPPSRGLEIRTLEVVHEGELGEPFTAVRFANRNVALLQKDGGITIYVQNYKTSKYAGSDTVPIQVSFKKDTKRDTNIEMSGMFIYGRHFPSAAKKLNNKHPRR